MKPNSLTLEETERDKKRPIPSLRDMRDGHYEVCNRCGHYCNCIAGNPNLWPVALAVGDDDGVIKWFCTSCASYAMKILRIREGCGND